MFSQRMMPMSTIVPMAMAMPDRATMLASTPKVFIAMKHISTASGSSDADQQRAAQVHHHHDHDDDRDEDLLDQRRVQRAQRLVDQPGAVVERHDGHLAGGDPVGPLVAGRGAEPGQPGVLVQPAAVEGLEAVRCGERLDLVAVDAVEVDDRRSSAGPGRSRRSSP